MQEIGDADALKERLWNEFPEARAGIEELERREREFFSEYGEALFVGVYDYISEIFWWEVFEPALRRGDDGLIERCTRFAEVLLGSSSELIREAVDIRVVSHLERWPVVLGFAGPKLHAKLVP